MAFTLTVNVHVDIDQICVRALFETFHHNGDAVRDLIPHEQQRLLTNDFCHQLFFRHVGVGVIIKVMWALHGIAAQCIEQYLTAIVIPYTDCVDIIEHAQRFQLFPAGLQIGRLLDKIRLVDDGNSRAATAAQHIHQHHFGFVQCAIGLKQHHGNVHICNGVAGRLVHPLTQFVACLVHTGRIQQNILQRPAGNDARDAGTGGLRLGGDDRHLFADQKVGQAGFAYIGTANDRYKNGRRIIMPLNRCCVTQNLAPVCFVRQPHGDK